MTPQIHEIYVLTYWCQEDRQTVLLNDKVYLVRKKVVKAAWDHNQKLKVKPDLPRVTVTVLEQYIRTRENEADYRGECRGEYNSRN